jgi:hypothetical protein
VTAATPSSVRNGSVKQLRGWARFWTGRLDLDALAWEITELVDDIDIADPKVEEATQKATRLWRSAYGSDDLLLSVSGMRRRTTTSPAHTSSSG